MTQRPSRDWPLVGWTLALYALAIATVCAADWLWHHRIEIATILRARGIW